MDRMVMVLNLYVLPSGDGSKFIFIAIAFLLRASGDGSKFIFIAIAFLLMHGRSLTKSSRASCARTSSLGIYFVHIYLCISETRLSLSGYA